MKKIKIDRNLISFTKINTKCIRNLNVKFKTLNLPEDNIGENLGDFRFGDNFLDTTPKARLMKKKLKWYFIRF